MRPTQAPAVGPPRIVAAMIVETETANSAPRGIVTGRADANMVPAIQKRSPPMRGVRAEELEALAIGKSGSMGNTRVVATSATALVATTPAM